MKPKYFYQTQMILLQKENDDYTSLINLILRAVVQ